MFVKSRKHLVALGDSHLESMKLAAELNIIEADSHHFCIIPGATAIGLRNPNSLTDAITAFKAALATQPRESYVLIHLGEVDCGFVIWWRAQKLGESVEIQFRQSLAAYRQFLEFAKSEGFFRICVAGAVLPTIRDGMDFGEVANKRSDVRVDIKRRSDLTRAYNSELKNISDQLSLHYFDISGEISDRSTSLVHDFFRNPDPADHHLDKDRVVGIWASKYNSFVKAVCL